MGAKLLAFCLRSLYREYGVAFLRRVVFAHPVATLRGMARFSRKTGAEPAGWQGGKGSLAGLGFCLKPLAPPCPSGRANHRCLYLETGAEASGCRHCRIRDLAVSSLAGGSTVYIMTSAQDLLQDVLLPALEHGRFRSGLLTMCRYSFEPMSLALAICGVEARLIPFAHGDCRNYRAWREADLGRKPEQTVLDEDESRLLSHLLDGCIRTAEAGRPSRNGNLYEPGG